MKVIIIGAGRGHRVMPYSKHKPKCFTEVNGKRIIDYALEAFKKLNLNDLHFIGGYLIDVVKKEYPQFIFHNNSEWETNNILASLFFAESVMKDGFISAYSDILFTPEIIKKLVKSPYDITIVIDTKWKFRYNDRSQHPMDDAEKVVCKDNRIVRISRKIPNERADGEFIGIVQFSPKGAQKFIDYYHKLEQKYKDKTFQGNSTFRKAYLIDLFQEMLQGGEKIFQITTDGGYYEIDTVEDLRLVSKSILKSQEFSQ